MALVGVAFFGFASVVAVCVTAWKVTTRKTDTAPVRELLERVEKVEQRVARQEAERLVGRR